MSRLLGRDVQRDIDAKAKTDRRFAEASKGVMGVQKIGRRPPVGTT